MGQDRNPSWAITDVPEELVAEFSTRARQIEVEKDRLVAEYVATHGRQPSDATVIRLRAQATLATRPEKQVPVTTSPMPFSTKARSIASRKRRSSSTRRAGRGARGRRPGRRARGW